MKRVAMVAVSCLLLATPAWAQIRPQGAKQRQVLALYEKFVSVEQRLERLENRMKEVETELEPFLQSESFLTLLSGLAMYTGAVRLGIPEWRDVVSEEDSLITKLVTASAGLTGDGARYADEGVRLLREQHVYLQRQLQLAEQVVGGMRDLLRSIGEGRLDQTGIALELQRLGETDKQIDALDEKRELAVARAKDAFARLKAAP